MTTTMKNWEESVLLNDGLTYGANAIVSRVKSMVNRPMMMTLKESPMSQRGSRDSDEVEVKLRSKIEYLNHGYTNLINEAVENKHSMEEIKERLKSIVLMLEKRSQHPRNLNPHHQVPISNLEQDWKISQLGYRSGPLTVANRDSRLKKIEMPSFDGSHVHDWLGEIEHFFAFGRFREEDKLDVVAFSMTGKAKKWFAWVMRRQRFRDWADFKQKLLDRFEHVTNSVKEVSVSSIDCQGYSFSSLKTMLKQASLPESEVILKTDSFPVSDHKSTMRRKLGAIDCVVKIDSFQGHESVKSLNLEHEMIKKICSLSPVQETVVIPEKSSRQRIHLARKFITPENPSRQNALLNQENASSLIREQDLQSTTGWQTTKSVFEDSVTIYRDDGNVTRLVTEPLKSGNKEKCVSKSHCGSDTWQPAIMNERFDHWSDKKAGNGKVSRLKTMSSMPSGVHHLFDHTLGRVPSKLEKLKRIKTWKFKFKNRQCKLMQKVEIIWGDVRHTRRLTVAVAEVKQHRNIPKSLRLKSSNSQVWHRWKDKIGVLHKVSKLVLLKLDFLHLPRIHAFTRLVREYREDLELCFATVVRQNIQNRRQLIPKTKCELIKWIQGRDLLWEKFREQASIHVRHVVFVQKECYKNYIFKENHRDGTVLKRLQLKHNDSFFQRLAKKLQTTILVQWLLRALLHHVRKLREVIWQWFCFRVQPHGYLQRSSPTILLSSSLRSSLISREGVYKRVFACLLIMDVMVWRCESEKRKLEFQTRMLLLQYKQIRTKCYKSRMFKYKQRVLEHKIKGLMKIISMNKLTYVSCRVKLWIADWFEFMNNKLGGDLKKIRVVGEYYKEIFQAAMMNCENVELLWSSDEIDAKGDEYWPFVMPIMGQSEIEELSAAHILYVCMHCADTLFLEADICQLGMDQQTVKLLAREYCDDTKRGHKPIILSHHMLSGLQQGQEKMSKSDPSYVIFMEDEEVHVIASSSNYKLEGKLIFEGKVLIDLKVDEAGFK